MSRIVWLATADARGHLMRCQLLTHHLRARGHDVDVVTTSTEGQAFLAAFGIASALLSDHYRVEFDDRQHMQRARTEWRMFRYLTSPWRFWRDVRWLERRAQGASLIVNDSFHPALLMVRWLRPWSRLPHVVHVYGKHLRQAVEANYSKRWPKFLERAYQHVIGRATDDAFARIQHALGGPANGREVGPRTYEVPPVLAPPTRSISETRARLGVAPHEKLAVAYLNPHFADPAIAEAVERAAQAAGCRLHAIGEGYATRPNWTAHDIALVDAINAADVFISAPGVAALGQALALRVPLAAIVTDQPEQRGNLAWLAGSSHAIVPLEPAHFEDRLSEALTTLLRSPSRSTHDKRASSTTAFDTWTRILESLMANTQPTHAAQENQEWKAA